MYSCNGPEENLVKSQLESSTVAKERPAGRWRWAARFSEHAVSFLRPLQREEEDLDASWWSCLSFTQDHRCLELTRSLHSAV